MIDSIKSCHISHTVRVHEYQSELAPIEYLISLPFKIALRACAMILTFCASIDLPLLITFFIQWI